VFENICLLGENRNTRLYSCIYPVLSCHVFVSRILFCTVLSARTFLRGLKHLSSETWSLLFYQSVLWLYSSFICVHLDLNKLSHVSCLRLELRLYCELASSLLVFGAYFDFHICTAWDGSCDHVFLC
jgi:hypothetical protein